MTPEQFVDTECTMMECPMPFRANGRFGVYKERFYKHIEGKRCMEFLAREETPEKAKAEAIKRIRYDLSNNPDEVLDEVRNVIKLA